MGQQKFSRREDTLSPLACFLENGKKKKLVKNGWKFELYPYSEHRIVWRMSIQINNVD